MIFILKFSKGPNSIKTVDGVTVIVLCILSDQPSLHLFSLCRARLPDVTYQVPRQLADCFWKRRVKIFTINGYGSHLDHVSFPLCLKTAYEIKLKLAQ